MTEMKTFSLSDIPLAGTALIEASAGTGKTYTITGLFLRLILEQRFSVNEILVVTFTEAATQELKERIRRRLREAIAVFSGSGGDDKFLTELAMRHHDSDSAVEALREALRSFDEAAIFTIHGFCRRMLSENAFESGSLFDTELVEDESDIVDGVIDDFWRIHFYTASPLFIRYAVSQGMIRRKLTALVRGILSHRDVKIVPQVENPITEPQEHAYRNAFDDLRESWRAGRDEVSRILSEDKGLNRNRYRTANIPGWIRAMDAVIEGDGGDPVLFKEFERFTGAVIGQSVKKGFDPPTHSFFDECDRFMEVREHLVGAYDQRILWLKAELCRFVISELDSRKQGRNVRSFDDLLTGLRNALDGEHGPLLSQTIRRKFRAALIDEFQDTDPIQYDIFRRVFGTGNELLFLIGDPKQAIYSFRGADVFTYMKAAREVEERYTLEGNWRSTPTLIKAVNTLFGLRDRPFVYDAIGFHRAVPAEGSAGSGEGCREEKGYPLQVWYISATEYTGSAGTVTKGAAYETIPGAVGGEILRLLGRGDGPGCEIEGRRLREQDIAVIVRTNREARLMQEGLSRLAIPTVLFSMDNLFESHEALEMQRIFAAVAEPGDETLLRSALLTDVFGMTGEDLQQLRNDEAAWAERMLAFRDYHDLWQRQGVMAMVRSMMEREAAMPRLMEYRDGERRNTNLLHLSEVLHHASEIRGLTMAGLVAWLSEQRNRDLSGLKEYELRLESDENAVTIVTIHKSKGLEYPVVFFPFTWHGASRRDTGEPFSFHETDGGDTVTIDIGSPDREENRRRAEREGLAENLRLLYVALTRAKHRCYVVWGTVKGGETSAPAYLLSGDSETQIPETDDSIENGSAALKMLEARSGGSIEISPLPEAVRTSYRISSEEERPLTCRTFTGHIDDRWRIASFSSLVAAQPVTAELAEDDRVSLFDYHDRIGETDEAGREDVTDIFSFPKGTKAGTFLHEVLENIDFTTADAETTRQIVEEKLIKYAFDIRWCDVVGDVVSQVRSVPMTTADGRMTLSEISRDDRLNELEFYFPLGEITPEKLRRIFAQYAETIPQADFPERIGRLRFSPASGFMRGFIDMVFRHGNRYYLVDWKSNYLGSGIEDYHTDALSVPMREHYYTFQSYIYTVALHRYLQARLPGYDYDRNFGGLYYLFLRGVDAARGEKYGVYRDRPMKELVDDLCRILAGEGK